MQPGVVGHYHVFRTLVDLLEVEQLVPPSPYSPGPGPSGLPAAPGVSLVRWHPHHPDCCSRVVHVREHRAPAEYLHPGYFLKQGGLLDLVRGCALLFQVFPKPLAAAVPKPKLHRPARLDSQPGQVVQRGEAGFHVLAVVPGGQRQNCCVLGLRRTFVVPWSVLLLLVVGPLRCHLAAVSDDEFVGLLG